jgi:hypothetical protein
MSQGVASIFIIVYQVHLCRNQNGEADSNGSVWGVPYRWGTVVIAYKKNKFKQHNLKPIQVNFFLLRTCKIMLKIQGQLYSSLSFFLKTCTLALMKRCNIVPKHAFW